jgi:hypothetical protein
MQKVGRNDPCPCGSGKKFKKCCESKMISKRFMATKIDQTAISGKTPKLSSIFQKSVESPKKIERVVSVLGPQVKEKKEGVNSSPSIESPQEVKKDLSASKTESDKNETPPTKRTTKGKKNT